MTRANKIPSILIVCGLILTSVSQATILHVPNDQPTIQLGIDATGTGDTVLVHPGTYVENINFHGKDIVVGSLFLTTGDTSYITQTVIDGNRNSNVVRFENGESPAALLCGFTITNGDAGSGEGGGINCTGSSPTLSHLVVSENDAAWCGGIFCGLGSNPSIRKSEISKNRGGVGGGIFCWQNSSPTISNTEIRDNSASGGGGICCWINSSPALINVIIKGNTASSSNELDGGGGIFCWDNSHPFLSNVVISQNVADRGGGIYNRGDSTPIFDTDNRSSIYLNRADIGADLFSFMCPIVDVILDTFTVISPTDYYAIPTSSFTFDIRHSLIELIGSDVYVDPDGDDDNSGLSPNDPFRTIGFALSRIHRDTLNPNTINLAHGTYSASTNGEKYPLNCFVSLDGAGESRTILDAEGLRNVLICHGVNNVEVQDMTIRNGRAVDGGGIYCYRSTLSIDSVIITDCVVGRHGGGIGCREESNIVITNSSISADSAGSGGGIYCNSSGLVLDNVRICDNFGWWDGGGVWIAACDPTFIDVTICNNSIVETCIDLYHGGGIFCFQSNPLIVNCSIVDNYGSALHCKNNSNPILVNTISWDNRPSEISFHTIEEVWEPNSITVAYSNVQGGRASIVTNNNGSINWLDGNIDAEPLFVDRENCDLNLQKESPCVNSGTPFFIWNGDTLVNMDESEYVGSAPDMGAFESEFIDMKGDVDRDGVINTLDAVMAVNIVLEVIVPTPAQSWSADCSGLSGNCDGDGVVNVLDLVKIVRLILELEECP